jgi:hypothetical protein
MAISMVISMPFGNDDEMPVSVRFLTRIIVIPKLTHHLSVTSIYLAVAAGGHAAVVSEAKPRKPLRWQ